MSMARRTQRIHYLFHIRIFSPLLQDLASHNPHGIRNCRR
nr:MAG TPA: hypothetical protein [Caudoviricetes sp.]